MATSNVRAVITAEDNASKVIQGVGASFGKLTGAFTLGNLAAQGITKAFDQMKSAAAGVVKSAANFEQTRIGLENMLGSADKARKLLSQISDFAAKTPFEFPELAQATRQLVAFGFSADDAYKTMKQLGDVSAAVGAPINELAYLMGTLKTQGRAFTIDIRQFAQRGIPIYEYLGRVLKVNGEELTKMIEQGKVGFPQVQKAFELMTAQGEKFHGTMAKQSKSLSGLFSTLKDVLGQAGRALLGVTEQGDVVEGGIFDKLRVGVSELITGLNTNMPRIKQAFNDFISTVTIAAQQVGSYLWPKLVALKNSFIELWPTLGPIVKAIGTSLVIAIGLAVDAANVFLTVLKPVFDWLGKNTWAIYTIIGAFSALKVAMAVTAAVNAFIGGMAAIRHSISITRAALAIPWIMPAIAVGAALASIALVLKAIQSVKRAIDAMNGAASAAAAADKSNDAVLGRLNNLAKNGTPAQQKRAKSTLKGLADTGGFASGTSYAPGGMAWVGEKGPELMHVPKGSKILPHEKSVRQGGNTTINITVPMLSGSASERRKVARLLIKDIQDVAAISGLTAAQMLDSKYGLIT